MNTHRPIKALFTLPALLAATLAFSLTLFPANPAAAHTFATPSSFSVWPDLPGALRAFWNPPTNAQASRIRWRVKSPQGNWSTSTDIPKSSCTSTTCTTLMSSLTNDTVYEIQVGVSGGTTPHLHWSASVEETPNNKPKLSFATNTYQLDEGASVTITVNIAPQLSSASSARIVSGGGSPFADVPEDVTLTGVTGAGATKTLALPANSSTATYTMSAVADNFSERTEFSEWRLSGIVDGPYDVLPEFARYNIRVAVIDTSKTPAPGNLQATATSGQLALSWSAPSGSLDATDRYDVEYKTSAAADQSATASDPTTGWVDAAHSGTGTTDTLTGLTNGTAYDVRVRAISSSADQPGIWATRSATPGSGNASLQTLTATSDTSAGGAFSNSLALDAAAQAYSALLPSGSSITHVKLTPTLATASASASMTIAKRGDDPVSIASAAASAAIEIGAGTTLIDVVVTSQNTETVRTYTVAITRTAATNRPLWSAVLTGAELPISGGVGCADTDESATCPVQMTDDDFATGGTTFTITALKGSGNGLALALSGGTSNQSLLALNFCVGGNSYLLSSKHITGGDFLLASGNPNWQVGQKIFVQISTHCPSPPPAAPTDLQVAGGDGSLSLSWTAPISGGTVSGYTVQYKTVAASSWTAATHSGTGTTSSITGLNNGSEYDVRVRASNADGDSSWVTGRGTPRSANVNLSALLVHTSEDGGSTFSNTALTLAPTFAAGINQYTASVANAATNVRVTPTVAISGATIRAGKRGGSLTAVVSGAASSSIALDVGANGVLVAVTSADGNSSNTYTITITRAAAVVSSSTLARAAHALAPEVARVVTGGAVDAVSERMERLMSGESSATADVGNSLTTNLAETLRANASDAADTTTEGWLSGLSFAQPLNGGGGGGGALRFNPVG